MISKKFFTICASSLLLTGCTSSSYLYKNVSGKPFETKTSLSSALTCAQKKLNSHSSKRSNVFLVRSIVDGTVRPRSTSDGPLADSGNSQLKGQLVKLITSDNGLVVDNYPLIFVANSKGTIGLNKYGRPEKNSLDNYRKSMFSFFNSSRKNKRKPELKRDRDVRLVTIDGSFTRADSSPVNNQGFGIDLNSDGSDAKVDFEVGNSGSQKVVSLNVNLIQTNNNIVFLSKSFDLNYNSNTKKYSLKSTAGEGGLGFSFSKTEIESIHSAQQTLIDAAALWISDILYNDAGISSCYSQKIAKRGE